MNPSILDLETCPHDTESILERLPEWDEAEALTRVPKNYKNPSAISDWLEQDKAGYVQRILDKSALMPEYASIVCVGILRDGRVSQIIWNDDPIPFPSVNVRQLSSEEELVREVLIHLSVGTFAGWNLLGFDLWMLVRRAWILGIEVSPNIFNPLSRYHYPDRFIDLMHVYAAGRPEEKRTSLDVALNALNLPPKTGDGKDFPKLWWANKTAALAYNANDCRVEDSIAKRMGVGRSVCMPVGYIHDSQEDLMPA